MEECGKGTENDDCISEITIEVDFVQSLRQSRLLRDYKATYNLAAVCPFA